MKKAIITGALVLVTGISVAACSPSQTLSQIVGKGIHVSCTKAPNGNSGSCTLKPNDKNTAGG